MLTVAVGAGLCRPCAHEGSEAHRLNMKAYTPYSKPPVSWKTRPDQLRPGPGGSSLFPFPPPLGGEVFPRTCRAAYDTSNLLEGCQLQWPEPLAVGDGEARNRRVLFVFNNSIEV